MIKNVIFRNPNDTTQESLNRFWISFSTWIEASDIVKEYYNASYVKYDNWDGGTYLSKVNPFVKTIFLKN